MVITRSLSLHLKSPGSLGPSGLAFACLSDCSPITLPLLSTLTTPAFFLRLSHAKLISASGILCLLLPLSESFFLQILAHLVDA